jgi:hypothetical protein
MTRTSRSGTPRGDSFRARVFTTFVFLILASCNAVAGEAPRPASSPAAAPQLEILPAAPAMRVSIDPETGRLIAPGPEDSRLEPLGRMPAFLPPVVHMPDGSLMMDLTGIYLTNAIVSIGWDGRPVLSCVEPEMLDSMIFPWLTLTAPPVRAKVKE